MKKKIALIFGITGQDGSYLAKFLIKKKYLVHGVIRKSSSFNTARIQDVYQEPFVKNKKLFLHYGDLTDFGSINSIIAKVRPDEIYNLAAQSHVAVSFENPVYTANVNALGTLRILESIKHNKLIDKTKFYQASTSELFGNEKYKIQNEKTPFYTKSPYGSSKLFSHWIVKNYRESYNLFAVSGILFNHESPYRGETFVTKKITRGLSKVFLNQESCVYLGNLYSKRDWGHAEDYVQMQWKMIQQKKPQDLVIATGKQYSVKFFIEECCKFLKWRIHWQGTGIKEVGYIKQNKKNRIIIRVSKKYFRPNELSQLKGDSRLAYKNLNFKPKHNLKSLVKEMMTYDINNMSKFN
jgi:GDPmannose 4,6-dehydratase